MFSPGRVVILQREFSLRAWAEIIGTKKQCSAALSRAGKLGPSEALVACRREFVAVIRYGIANCFGRPSGTLLNGDGIPGFRCAPSRPIFGFSLRELECAIRDLTEAVFSRQILRCAPSVINCDLREQPQSGMEWVPPRTMKKQPRILHCVQDDSVQGLEKAIFRADPSLRSG